MLWPAGIGSGKQHKGQIMPTLTPRIIPVMRSGYGAGALRADVLAGLTVAIVALPLAMAIAIASGATPAQGLVTAIVGGFVISALGGSRYQIGGPAGAFIVLVGATVAAHGMDGLILATLISGVMMALLGWLRLGGLIRHIPHAVTVGFTTGIGIIILASEIAPLLGLQLAHEPGPLAEKLPALWAVLGSLNMAAVALSSGTIVGIMALRMVAPRLPVLLIVVVLGTAVATLAGLTVDTIGSRFDGIPQTFPAPALPALTAEKLLAVLPAALSFTLLGAIESLLSAVVADRMTGERHAPNAELVAQGVANVATALFGGFCVTGTIARTATNVRAGAHGPVAGMLHAAFLLAFMLIAAPLASYVPLAVLAGVLAVVAWNMLERAEIAAFARNDRAALAVMAVTLGLTVFRDLIEGIAAGVILALVIAAIRHRGS
jgi:sulfate permease, SulP family